MKRLFIYTLSLACLSSFTVLSKDAVKQSPYQQVLAAVPALELPAKAAALVKQAKTRDLSTTTIEVTKAAVSINPSAAASVVGAIARAMPDMADVAAGTAAAEQPKQVSAIAKAAAAAAPSKAGKIVVAVCRAVPTDYRAVAIVVAQTVPASAKEVLKAVATAIPELKAGVEKALAAYTGDTVSVAAVLDQAASSLASADTTKGSSPRGPTVGAPFIPVSGTVTTITPATSGDVPTGGRRYARP